MDKLFAEVTVEFFAEILTWIWEHCSEDYTEYARTLISLGFSSVAVRAELSESCGLADDEIENTMKEVKNEG